jgi:hypothetical protein
LEGDFLVRLDEIGSRRQRLGFRRADVGLSLAKVEDKILQRNLEREQRQQEQQPKSTL